MESKPRGKYRKFLKSRTASDLSLKVEGIDICQSLEDLRKITENLLNKYIPLETDRTCLSKCPAQSYISWLEEGIDKGNKLCDELARIIFGLGISLQDQYETYKMDTFKENLKLTENLEIPYSLDVRFLKNGVSACWQKCTLRIGKNKSYFFPHHEPLRQTANRSYRKTDFSAASPEVKENIFEDFEKYLAELRRMTDTVGQMRLNLTVLERQLKKFKDSPAEKD